jgi:hypothetical protein
VGIHPAECRAFALVALAKRHVVARRGAFCFFIRHLKRARHVLADWTNDHGSGGHRNFNPLIGDIIEPDPPFGRARSFQLPDGVNPTEIANDLNPTVLVFNQRCPSPIVVRSTCRAKRSALKGQQQNGAYQMNKR